MAEDRAEGVDAAALLALLLVPVVFDAADNLLAKLGELAGIITDCEGQTLLNSASAVSGSNWLVRGSTLRNSENSCKVVLSVMLKRFSCETSERRSEIKRETYIHHILHGVALETDLALHVLHNVAE